MTGVIASKRLPATDDCVDVKWIYLEPVTAAPGALCRDDCRAAAEKSIQHDIPSRSAIHYRVCNQGDGFHRWMEREQIALVARSGKGIRAGIIPDVAPVAAVLPELNVVAMRPVTLLEYEHQLVLAAIERSHAGVVFDPDAEILYFGIDLPAGRH